MESAAESQELALGALSLACFGVGDRIYGIDVRDVREVVRTALVTPLPQAPELIEGIVDLRGSLVPLVDLGRALGVASERAGEELRIAVVEHAGLLFGLHVDAAIDVISVGEGEVHSPPELAVRTGYRTIRGMVRRAGHEPVLVLSLAELIERVHASNSTASTHAGAQ